MLLAGFFHTSKLALIKLVLIDVSPIIGRRVHWKTGSDGPVGSNDHIVLAVGLIPAIRLDPSVSCESFDFAANTRP
jgi:hypothetical protein